MVKFMVVGGFLDKEYVSAKRLVELYKLDKQECLLIDLTANIAIVNTSGNKIVLRPRQDGDYTSYVERYK